MYALLGIQNQPKLGLRILIEFFYHEMSAAEADGPVDPFHRISVCVVADAGCMRRNIQRLATDRATARQQSRWSGERLEIEKHRQDGQ